VVAPTKVAPFGEMNFPWEGISLGKRGPSCHGEKGTWDVPDFWGKRARSNFFPNKKLFIFVEKFSKHRYKNDLAFSI
jgi:hypothetical protein